jgi:hypothetical protein
MGRGMDETDRHEVLRGPSVGRLPIISIYSCKYGNFIGWCQYNFWATNIKLTLYKPLIRSVMTYACPTWEYATDTHLDIAASAEKSTIGNLDRCTPVRELHTASNPYVYNYIKNFVTCRGICVTKIRDSRSDDWIYWHFGYKFSQSHSIITLSLFYTLSVHRCTRTRIFRLH